MEKKLTALEYLIAMCEVKKCDFKPEVIESLKLLNRHELQNSFDKGYHAGEDGEGINKDQNLAYLNYTLQIFGRTDLSIN